MGYPKWSLVAVLAGGFVLAVPAAAAVTPKAIAAQAKSLLTQICAPELALSPTRLPAHYAYESFSVTGTPAGLDLSYADQRFTANPTILRVHEISFDTSYLPKHATTCARPGTSTLRVSGMTIYYDKSLVWRCTRTPHGRLVEESANGRLPRAALASLVASAAPLT